MIYLNTFSKSLKKYLLLITFIFTLQFLCSCQTKQVREKTSDELLFNNISNEIFINTLKSNIINLHTLVSNPNDFGLDDYKVSLGDFSEKSFNDYECTLTNYLYRLNAISPKKLSKKNQSAYKILTENLSHELEYNDYYFLNNYLSPGSGQQSLLPSYLQDYTFNSKKDIDDYLQILRITPNFFDSLIELERTKCEKGIFMNEFQAVDVINECKSFTKDSENHYLIQNFNQKIESLDFLSDNEINAYKELNYSYFQKYFISSYNCLANALNTYKKQSLNLGGLCNYKDGKIFYEGLVYTNTGSAKSVKEIEDMLENAMANDFNIIYSILKDNPTLPQSCSECNSKYNSPKNILSCLYKDLESIFPKAVVKKDDYTIDYVPKNLEAYEAPAYYMVPPIDEITENNIYINNKYYSDSDSFNLIPVLAHEGFPGHLYQTTYFRNTNPSHIRLILNYPGYTEGYATYVEMLSYKLAGFDELIAKYYAANTAFYLELYSLFDIYTNYEGKTVNDLINIGTGFGLDKEQIIGIYHYVIENPCNYLRYSVGYLEICELRDEYKYYSGKDFSLMKFHKFLLDFGPAPFDIIKQSMHSTLMTNK